MKNPLRRPSGFTLIELMITVAIVGILAAVAYPVYTDQIRKGRRADARAALMNLLVQQERYLTQRNTYVEFTKGNAAALPPPQPFKDFVGSNRAEASHLLGARLCQPATVSAPVPTVNDCIEVFAEPVGADPEITSMAIDTKGLRSCTGSNTARCWH